MTGDFEFVFGSLSVGFFGSVHYGEPYLLFLALALIAGWFLGAWVRRATTK